MEGTLAEIRMFGGNFAPRGWQLCNGQLLSIAQWTAVFALVGTIYGGDGQVTFGLPDFRGRAAVGTGNGAGLTGVVLGEMSGFNTSTLLITNLPAHNHQLTGNVAIPCFNDEGDSVNPGGHFMSASSVPGTKMYNSTSDGTMANAPFSLPTTIAGSSSPVSVMQPYTGINFVICVEGIFPSRD